MSSGVKRKDSPTLEVRESKRVKYTYDFWEIYRTRSEDQMKKITRIFLTRKTKSDPIWDTTIEGVAKLLPKLEKLEIKDCRLTSCGGAALLRRMVPLKILSIEGCGLPFIENPPHITTTRNLTELSFYNCENLTDLFFIQICKTVRNSLQFLAVEYTPLNEKGLSKGLKKLKEVSHLIVTGNPYIDGEEFLTALSHLKALELLQLDTLKKFVPSSFHKLSSHTKLHTVELPDPYKLHYALEDFQNIHSITTLVINDFEEITSSSWKKSKILLREFPELNLILPDISKNRLQEVQNELMHLEVSLDQ